MFRRTVFTAVPLFSAVAVKVDEPQKPPKENTSKSGIVCKPSELPLYPASSNLQKSCHEHKDSKMFSTVQGGVSAVRVEVHSVINAMSEQKKQLDTMVHDGKEKTKFVVDYLNQPDNTFPRVGAIGLGGLSGYIFGLRGGFMRRSFFATIGAAAIASICYPKDAEIYAQHGLVEAKKYAKIGYNFAYGIKPGDDVPGPSLPKIPTSFSELGESLSGLAKSAKDAVFAEKKK